MVLKQFLPAKVDLLNRTHADLVGRVTDHFVVAGRHPLEFLCPLARLHLPNAPGLLPLTAITVAETQLADLANKQSSKKERQRERRRKDLMGAPFTGLRRTPKQMKALRLDLGELVIQLEGLSCREDSEQKACLARQQYTCALLAYLCIEEPLRANYIEAAIHTALDAWAYRSEVGGRDWVGNPAEFLLALMNGDGQPFTSAIVL